MFGFTIDRGNDIFLPDILNHVEIDVLTVSECVDYWGSTVNSDDIVCVYDLAGGNNGQVGGCSVSYSFKLTTLNFTIVFRITEFSGIVLIKTS